MGGITFLGMKWKEVSSILNDRGTIRGGDGVDMHTGGEKGVGDPGIWDNNLSLFLNRLSERGKMFQKTEGERKKEDAGDN